MLSIITNAISTIYLKIEQKQIDSNIVKRTMRNTKLDEARKIRDDVVHKNNIPDDD